MPAVLPTLSNGFSAIYPVQRQVGFSTQVNQFISGAEQRWPTNLALGQFTLALSQVSSADRSNYDSFFADVKGAFDPTWTFQRRSNWLDNGNFLRGFSGWGLGDPNSGFAAPVSLVSRPYPGGSVYATVANRATTIPGNATFTFDFESPKIGASPGFAWDFSFWTQSNFFGNPPSVTPHLAATVLFFGSSGQFISAVSAGINLNSTGLWSQQTFTVPASSVPSSTAFLSLTISPYYNNVSSSSQSCPLDCMNWSVGNVSAYPQNVPGAMTRCAFLHDEFTWTENQDNENTYDIQLQFRQTESGGSLFPTVPTGVTTYPGAGPNGLLTGFPFVESDEYYTAMNNMPSGPRYAFAFYGSGLAGFPPRALKKWALSTPTLTDAQLATIEQEFVNMLGRWQSFQFVSPRTGKLHYPVRFDMDALAIQHVLPDVNSCTVKLVESFDAGFLA